MQREVLTRENSEDLDNEGRRTDICFALYRSVLHGSERKYDYIYRLLSRPQYIRCIAHLYIRLNHPARMFDRLYLIAPSLCLSAAADASGVIYSGKRMLHAHGQEGEILRDVTRTFPTEALFRDSAGVGQNLLANVLKACLYFHDDVG